MSTQEFKTVAVRSAAVIVQQTEDLARMLMKSFYQREPAEPGYQFRESQCPRAKHVWEMACQIQEMLTETDPENAVSELDDEPKVDAGDNFGFVVLQEGGSSCEMYAQGFESIEDADAFRTSCEEGAYRTSKPIQVPKALLADPLFMAAVSDIVDGATNVSYPEDSE